MEEDRAALVDGGAFHPDIRTLSCNTLSCHNVSRQADQQRRRRGHTGTPRTEYGIVWIRSNRQASRRGGAPWEKGGQEACGRHL
jgi:hypothetical protein